MPQLGMIDRQLGARDRQVEAREDNNVWPESDEHVSIVFSPATVT